MAEEIQASDAGAERKLLSFLQFSLALKPWPLNRVKTFSLLFYNDNNYLKDSYTKTWEIKCITE